MAHTLPQALLQHATTHLARPVGAQRLAELRDHRLSSAGNFLDRMEIWQLPAGAGFEIRQSGFHANTAAKVLTKDKPGSGWIEM